MKKGLLKNSHAINCSLKRVTFHPIPNRFYSFGKISFRGRKDTDKLWFEDVIIFNICRDRPPGLSEKIA